MVALTLLVFAGQASAQSISLKHIPDAGRTEGVVLGQGTDIVVEISQTGLTQSVNAIQITFDFDASLLTLHAPSGWLKSGDDTVSLLSITPAPVPASASFTFTTKVDVTGQNFSIGLKGFTLDAVTLTPSAVVSFNTVRPPLHLDTQIESPAQNNSVLELEAKQAGDTIQLQLFVPDAAGQQVNAFQLELALLGKTAPDYISNASREWVSSVSGTNLVLSLSMSPVSVSDNGYVGQVDLMVTGALSGQDTLRITGASVTGTQLDVSNAELSFASVCPGDFDTNGMIGVPDFLLFVGVFGTSSGDGTFNALMDMDGNGIIGVSDFLAFVDVFGTTCEQQPSSGGGGGQTGVYIPDANLRAVIEDRLGKASGAQITSAEMATLTYLVAQNSDISDLTGLEHATNLTELNLLGTSIVDVSPLSNLTNLTELNLNSTSIVDVSPLSNLTNLTRLDLGGTSIVDVSPLSNLTNLTRLDLGGTSIVDVSPLSNLTNLTELRLNHTSIVDVSPLSDLTNLTRLHLYNTSIVDVSPLSNLTNLTRLHLYNNSIVDVSPLSNLTNLTNLILFNNSISDVSPLSDLTNLTELHLENTSISDVSPLSNLTNLTWLNLYNNSIVDVSPLSNLTNLKGLVLSDNSISDLSPLVANTGLGSGDTVYVSNNPLSVTSINTHIPALQGRGVTVLFNASTPAEIDYDTDNDGLIEISNLAQLNAIRWDLDGDGSPYSGAYQSAFPNATDGMGCPSSGCTGYELTANLDFDTNGNGNADAGDAYWNNGQGWTPIGEYNNEFSATFHGNDHTIANLYIINWPYPSGLFGETDTRSNIKKIGLVGVNVDDNSGSQFSGSARGGLVGVNAGAISDSYVAGSGSQVTGRIDIGGLAGSNSGSIIRSYATADVTGDYYVGGLVGENRGSITDCYATGNVTGIVGDGDFYGSIGGLTGGSQGPANTASITRSYASGDVKGSSGVGGLVGSMRNPITASYATGNVTGNTRVGGLVGGTSTFSTTITASYSTGSVIGNSDVGGLVGYNFTDGLQVIASYWDTQTSGQSTSAGGEGKTTIELQSPTDYTGIYTTWNLDLNGDGTPDDPWNFGTSSQYPTLKNLGTP